MLTEVLARSYGDPDTFIRNDGQFPTRDFWQWSSASSFESDVVRIDAPTAGTYRVGVYAYSSCSFTLVGRTTGAMVTLADGVPVRGQLARGEFAYYRFYLDTHKDVTFSVTPFSGGDPDLFISTTNQRPNQANHTWQATSYADDSLTISVTDPDHCMQCWYYVAGLFVDLLR